MEVSSQLVNLAAKAETKLVEAVAGTLPTEEQEAFLRECNELIEEAKAPELIRKLLEQRARILAMPNVDDIDGCFGILLSLLYKTSNPEADIPPLAQEIAAGLLETVDEKAALRIKLVATLYNMLPSKSLAQLEVLLQVVSYASEAQLLRMLTSFFAGVDAWLAAWELSTEDRRRVYLLLADVLGKVGDAEQSQRFLMTYLATFDGAPADVLAEVKPAAARAAVGAVRAPVASFSEQHGLLAMDAVKQLEKDPDYEALHQLLHIFSVEKLDEYMRFREANAATLAKYDIDHEACVANMRLLSLCSLATEHEEIPYSAIAQTLKIDEDEVEEWVLRCISAGLMAAKMDQLGQVVVISRCTNRVFGSEQWKVLQSKLHTWRKNVHALLASISRNNDAMAQRSSSGGTNTSASQYQLPAAEGSSGGGKGGGGRKSSGSEHYEPRYSNVE